MSEWKHKGINIALDSSGKFVAWINGARVSASSLDAIKKRIDKVSQFQPFKAFVLGSWRSDDLENVEVIGIEKGRGSRTRISWKLRVGGMAWSVYQDTPENRARAKTYLDMRKAHEAIKERMEDELGAARDAITVVPLEPPK